MHQLFVTGDDRVRALLEGQHDIHAHRGLAPCADVPCFHNAAGGAGDDHPFLRRNRLAERHGLFVGRISFLRACGAVDRYFAIATIRGEYLERVPQLAHRAIDDLEVAAAHLIGGHLVDRFLEHRNQVGDSFLPADGLDAVTRRRTAGHIGLHE